MPIDPRIALMGNPDRTDVFGAFNTSRAAEQTFRQNQMAMQAAETTAQRNMMARQRAAAVDPANRPQVNAFVNEVGADVAAPYLEAWNNVGGMFRAEAEEGRAASKFGTDQSEAYMTQLPRFAAQLLGDASPANVARVRAQAVASGFPAGVYDALATRLADLPPEQQQQAIQSYLLTTGGGETAVKALYPARELVNTGATQVPVNLSPLARDPASGAPVPVTGALRNTPDPRAPQIVQTADGIYSATPGGGPAAPVTDAQGNILQPYDSSPAAPAGAAGDARTSAAEGLRSTLESLRGYYSALNESGGIVSTERGGGENLLASAGASLPGRVLGRTFGSRDQTQRDNIQTAIPMIVASLKDLTGMSAQQMNSNVELQLFLNTVSAPDQSIETVNEALARFERYVDRVAGETAGGGGGGAADPLEGRTAVGPGGQRIVRRGGQWVPQ